MIRAASVYTRRQTAFLSAGPSSEPLRRVRLVGWRQRQRYFRLFFLEADHKLDPKWIFSVIGSINRRLRRLSMCYFRLTLGATYAKRHILRALV